MERRGGYEILEQLQDLPPHGGTLEWNYISVTTAWRTKCRAMIGDLSRNGGGPLFRESAVSVRALIERPEDRQKEQEDSHQ